MRRFLMVQFLVGIMVGTIVLQAKAFDPPDSVPPTMDSASQGERASLRRLSESITWVRRAIVAMRLERYRDETSLNLLMKLAKDPSWQVRCYAIRSLARCGESVPEDFFALEQEPRVVRAILRHRYTYDVTRLARGMKVLVRSNQLNDKILACELGVVSGDEKLFELAKETTKTVILRMGRIEAGALSPRLAYLTGQKDMRKHYRWHDWVLKSGRRFAVHARYSLGTTTQDLAPSLLATLPSDRFIALEDYLATLGKRKLDLAIVLDCTASMAQELAQAQGGIDDMMMFVSDVVADLRIAIIGYRDRQDEFKTKAWDFTSSLETARKQLWQLTAEGGGDNPEAVQDALELAYTKLSWRKDSDKTLVLVGDAPPHVGRGTSCINMAKRAHDIAELLTHVIQAAGKDVKHFPEIAEAGGGQCVTLEDGDSLIAQITGLTLGDAFEEEFQEFFRVYLELCR
ncbi:MAG: VWA domain-containing protein [Planctomycetota bacterium]|nr:VWA domain-containing protein [Planctomycetota bacterium]